MVCKTWSIATVLQHLWYQAHVQLKSVHHQTGCNFTPKGRQPYVHKLKESWMPTDPTSPSTLRPFEAQASGNEHLLTGTIHIETQYSDGTHNTCTKIRPKQCQTWTVTTTPHYTAHHALVVNWCTHTSPLHGIHSLIRKCYLSTAWSGTVLHAGGPTHVQ